MLGPDWLNSPRLFLLCLLASTFTSDPYIRPARATPVLTVDNTRIAHMRYRTWKQNKEYFVTDVGNRCRDHRIGLDLFVCSFIAATEAIRVEGSPSRCCIWEMLRHILNFKVV